MFKFVILLSAVACALGAAIPEGMLPQLDGRIVGGTQTRIEDYPYQISLQRNGGHSCGGFIYSQNVIVTAAHCVRNAVISQLSVRAGSTYFNSGGIVVAVANFRYHNNYNANTMVNDVAVARLSSPLTFGSTMQSIGIAMTAPPTGTPAVVTGWGTTSSGGWLSTQLLYVIVDIVDRFLCASDYGYASNEILETMICAEGPGKDSCQGDSGGPLAAGGAVVGIVSWGYGCADPTYPGVYADAARARPWIVTNAATV